MIWVTNILNLHYCGNFSNKCVPPIFNCAKHVENGQIIILLRQIYY